MTADAKPFCTLMWNFTSALYSSLLYFLIVSTSTDPNIGRNGFLPGRSHLVLFLPDVNASLRAASALRIRPSVPIK